MRSVGPTAAITFTVLLLPFFVTSFNICRAQNSTPPEPTPASKPRIKLAPQPKLTKRQLEGLRLLQAAEAESAGLDPAMRAFILWRLSHAYESLDKKKSERLVNASFQTTRAIQPSAQPPKCMAAEYENQVNIQEWLQQRILTEMIENGSLKRAEELVASTEPDVGTRITSKLITVYTSKKNFQHAEELLHRLAESKDYPYDAATSLLAALGPDQASDRVAIFNEALTNFEQNGTIPGTRTADLATLIEQDWPQLPSPLVLEAIDKLLEEGKTEQQNKLIATGSIDQILTLNSTYELRLFQLLPVLQELDKDRAEVLLRENAELRAKLDKYPKGQVSFVSDEGSLGVTADSNVPELLELSSTSNEIDRVRKESESDPARALADALQLPLGSSRAFFSPRVASLWFIAATNTKTNPAVSKVASDELFKLVDQLAGPQLLAFPDLPDIYLKLGDEQAAIKALKAALKVAQRIYAWDTDPDDPNQAFKAIWPSTYVWQGVLGIAEKMSPDLAEEVLADIPDPDIAAVVKVQRGSILVGKALHLTGAVCHKDSPSLSLNN